MTSEDTKNILALIDAGARAISLQNPLEQAGKIMIEANSLSKKLVELMESLSAK